MGRELLIRNLRRRSVCGNRSARRLEGPQGSASFRRILGWASRPYHASDRATARWGRVQELPVRQPRVPKHSHHGSEFLEWAIGLPIMRVVHSERGAGEVVRA